MCTPKQIMLHFNCRYSSMYISYPDEGFLTERMVVWKTGEKRN